MFLPQVFENLLKWSIRFFDVCGKEQAAKYEPQANKKFFGAAVFQKCCRGVSEQPTFAEQIKLHKNPQVKSKRELRFPGKLGMCPSLAELYASGFSKTSRRQPKVF